MKNSTLFFITSRLCKIQKRDFTTLKFNNYTVFQTSLMHQRKEK